MSLDVVCPHCDFRLQLPMKMAGCTIRCPNTDCNGTFEVPPPVAEIIPVSKPKPIPTAKPKPKEVRWTDDAEPKPKPKELRWTDDADPKPKPAPRPRPAPVQQPEPEETYAEPIRRSPRKKNRSPMILAGLAVLLAFVGVGFVIFLFVSRERDERRLAQAAEQAYAAGDFAKARRDFTELATNHEGSEQLPRYQFFGNLAQLQAEVQQLGTTGDPEEALASFAKFLEQYSESPFTKPGSGSGADIVPLGLKLGSAAHGFCANRLNEHRKNRSDPAPLDSAATISRRTRAMLAELERFRDKDSPSSKDILSKFDAFDASLLVERQRSASVAEWRAKLAAPSSAVVENFQSAMSKLGLAEDPHVVGMLAAARNTLSARIRFVPARRPAVPFPAGESEPNLSAKFMAGSPRPRKAEGMPELTCFGIAEGCLFACDASTGEFLWGRRIAAATASHAMLDIPTITGEIALVAFPHGLAALKVRTGEPVWYQTLPAACRARPAVVGNMVFAALLDESGTVAALDLRTGEFLGSIALQQPLGANVMPVPGTPFLLALGLAREAYLLEITSNELPALARTRTIVTGHAAASVLIDPLLVPANGSTRMILATAVGSAASKITEYSFPPPGEWNSPNAEWLAPKAMEKTLFGWPWQTITSDGERLSFTTDSGTIGWYGWKSPAEGLFPLLPEPVAEPGETISRSCIAAMADDGLWAVAGENLLRYQAAVGAQGYRMIAVGKPRRVGEAVGRAQPFPQANLSVLMVKPSPKEPVQLFAFDTDRGDVLWQVELK